MKRYKEEQHSIDFIFVLLLFCVFSLSILSVVYIGSHIYTSTTQTMEMNYNQNTVIQYIIEKVRQGNAYQQIEVKELEDCQALCISQNDYTTYIYEDQHVLKELFIHNEESFHKGNGTTIMEVDKVSFSISHSLLEINVAIHNELQTSYISLIGGAADET